MSEYVACSLKWAVALIKYSGSEANMEFMQMLWLNLSSYRAAARCQASYNTEHNDRAQLSK